MYIWIIKRPNIYAGERKKLLKKLVTYFLCDNIWSEDFSIVKLAFRCNAVFKDCVLFSRFS